MSDSRPGSRIAEGEEDHFERPWYRNLNTVLVLGIVLATIVAVPSVIYYELGYNSVNGTHPELVSGYRSFGYMSATFYITVHVWSWAGSLDTEVANPTFTLTANNLPLRTLTLVPISETFQPNNFVSYTLTFTTNDDGIVRNIQSSNSTNLVVQMSADVSAGWFRELITRSDSSTWTFG